MVLQTGKCGYGLCCAYNHGETNVERFLVLNLLFICFIFADFASSSSDCVHVCVRTRGCVIVFVCLRTRVHVYVTCNYYLEKHQGTTRFDKLFEV